MKLKSLYLGALCALAFTLSVPALLAADATGTTAPADASASPAPGGDAATSGTAGQTLLQQIKNGGVIMIPIGLLSIATVYLMADGTVRSGRKKMTPMQHEESVKNFFRQGDYVGAFNYCKINPSPLTNVLRVGIGLLGEGKQIAEEGMIGELGKENGKLQTQISYLSVIGVCSPMVGLLGTVWGMIGAFSTLGTEGIGDPSKLAGDIGEVLIATASGLCIAIPSLVGAGYLSRKVDNYAAELEVLLERILRRTRP